MGKSSDSRDMHEFEAAAGYGLADLINTWKLDICLALDYLAATF
jgi:hypothetical protein